MCHKKQASMLEGVGAFISQNLTSYLAVQRIRSCPLDDDFHWHDKTRNNGFRRHDIHKTNYHIIYTTYPQLPHTLSYCNKPKYTLSCVCKRQNINILWSLKTTPLQTTHFNDALEELWTLLKQLKQHAQTQPN